MARGEKTSGARTSDIHMRYTYLGRLRIASEIPGLVERASVRSAVDSGAYSVYQ